MAKNLYSKLAIVLTAAALSACTSLTGTDSASINSSRSQNSMMVSDAQYKQQNRQRTAELEESVARNAKNQMNMQTIRGGIDTVREGIGLINYIKGVF